jgi:hypothetical protein
MYKHVYSILVVQAFLVQYIVFVCWTTPIYCIGLSDNTNILYWPVEVEGTQYPLHANLS